MLLQDECRELSRALSRDPNARQIAREAAGAHETYTCKRCGIACDRLENLRCYRCDSSMAPKEYMDNLPVYFRPPQGEEVGRGFVIFIHPE